MGTAVLVLTKPISRAGFVLAEAVSQLVVPVCASALGVALCIATTGASSAGSIAPPSGRRAVAGLRRHDPLARVMLSAAIKHQAPAIGAGVGVLVGLFVLTGLPLIRDHSPAGLMAATGPLFAAAGRAVVAPDDHRGGRRRVAGRRDLVFQAARAVEFAGGGHGGRAAATAKPSVPAVSVTSPLRSVRSRGTP